MTKCCVCKERDDETLIEGVGWVCEECFREVEGKSKDEACKILLRRKAETEVANRKLKMIEPKYRTFWRRFWAGWIDALVFMPLAFIDPLKYSESLPTFILVIWFLFHETAWYLYSVLMHGKFGQTLGKMAFKVKVIDKSEDKSITYRQAFLRDIVLIALGTFIIFSMLPDVIQGKNPYEPTELMKNSKEMLKLFLLASIQWFWFFAELITMLTNKKRRAVHDFIAGSVVIKLS